MILKIDKAPKGKAAEVAKHIIRESPAMAVVKVDRIHIKFQNGRKKTIPV